MVNYTAEYFKKIADDYNIKEQIKQELNSTVDNLVLSYVLPAARNGHYKCNWDSMWGLEKTKLLIEVLEERGFKVHKTVDSSPTNYQIIWREKE